MNRRNFITGLVSLVAAPAIVRASSLMAISPLPAASRQFIYSLGVDYATGIGSFGIARLNNGVWKFEYD